MTNEEAIKQLGQWQWDMMHGTRTVKVAYYSLEPQSTGFLLRLEYYAFSDKMEETIFGDTIAIVVQKAVEFLDEKREEIRRDL